MKIFYVFKRNHWIGSPFGRVKVARFVEVSTPLGPAVRTIYDMDEVHSLDFADETPEAVTRVKGMSPKMYTALCDDAVKTAIEHKKENFELKTLFQRYCLDGILEEVPAPEAVA